MKKSLVSRRDVLKGLAAGTLASPLVITSKALGDAVTPPASERIAIGHIGVGDRGRDLFREIQRLPRRPAGGGGRCLQGSTRSLRRHVPRQALRRFPRTAGPQGYRRGGDRHARPLARAAGHRRGPPRQGCLRGEAAGDQRRAGHPLPQGVPKTSGFSNTAPSSGAWVIAASAASWFATDGSARCTRSKSSRPKAGRAARPSSSPCRPRWTTTCGSARPPRRPSLPIAATRRARTGSTTTRSAIWPAGAPTRWTS